MHSLDIRAVALAQDLISIITNALRDWFDGDKTAIDRGRTRVVERISEAFHEIQQDAYSEIRREDD
jgi:hypothetical protein